MSGCATPGCEFDAWHEPNHPCGRHIIDGQPCRFCGEPEPCDGCWRPVTVADLKAIAAEAAADTRQSPSGDWTTTREE